MNNSVFCGRRLRLEIYGASHGEKIGVKIDGLPRGKMIDTRAMTALLARRAPGTSPFSSRRREPDEPVFLSGLDADGRLDGNTLEAVIYNKDVKTDGYAVYSDIPRPSHADYPALVKYGADADISGGGHFSGRMTAPLTLAGGICLGLLNESGVSVGAHIFSIGNIKDAAFDSLNVNDADFAKVRQNSLPMLDAAAVQQAASLISQLQSEGDSVGGVAECAVTGLPVGVGEHMFDGLENAISRMIFAIPGVKGIEFGSGFEGVGMRGSEYNDAFTTDGKNVTTTTNHVGGILGGMSYGMPVIFRVAVKPTPSIAKEQKSVSLSRMENTTLKITGRHDSSILLRVIPVIEAATAIAIYDLI